MDPRTPVIVGAAELLNRSDDYAEPVAMMGAVARAALEDARGELREGVQEVRVVKGFWRYADPGRLVGQELNLPGVRTALGEIGGNEAYNMLGTTCADIQAGRLDCALIVSAETLRSRRRAHAAGDEVPRLIEADSAAPDMALGKGLTTALPHELQSGVALTANFYACAETALRHRLGESAADHLERVAALWARASAVAAANPNAWHTRQHSVTEIATASETNRPIASPYPKLMTANMDVDMAAAVVVCSADIAAAAGVPTDRWVFPHACTQTIDAEVTSQRRDLDASPAMRLGAQAALELAGIDVDDCALLDLYSCFPVAVQVAQRELSIDPAREFTITGGLTFAGGPLNTYCMHALARGVELLRDRPDARALLTGNGGYFSKHSFVVLSGEPAADPFAMTHPNVDCPLRPLPSAVPATAELESYTVTFDRSGAPERAILACLDNTESRHWATNEDIETMRALLETDLIGATVELADLGGGDTRGTLS